MKVVILLLVLLLAACGCSNSNVKVSATDESAHEQLLKEDEGGAENLTMRPKVISVPQPAYPTDLPDPNLAGMIMIRVLVGVHGEPIEAVVNQELHPELDRAARDAALKGTYQPGREGEIPREAWVSVPFRYPPPPPASGE